MGRFEGKKVLITGASRGIGRATVRAFVAEGATVMASGRNKERLAQVLSEHGDAVRTASVDVTSVESVRSLVRHTIEELQGLDVLVNCAGTSYAEPILEVTEEAWRGTLAVNLDAALFASIEAARHMVDHGGGAIVNVSSIDAFLAEAPFVHYSSSKAALSMVTKAFALELGHRGIRCNALGAGVTWTGIWEEAVGDGDPADTYRALVQRIPMRRAARASEQAAIILFLASDDASFINGATVIADGGQMCGLWSRHELEPPLPDGPVPDYDY